MSTLFGALLPAFLKWSFAFFALMFSICPESNKSNDLSTSYKANLILDEPPLIVNTSFYQVSDFYSYPLLIMVWIILNRPFGFIKLGKCAGMMMPMPDSR